MSSSVLNNLIVFFCAGAFLHIFLIMKIYTKNVKHNTHVILTFQCNCGSNSLSYLMIKTSLFLTCKIGEPIKQYNFIPTILMYFI